MIQADRYEKCCYTDHETNPRNSQIVEYLVWLELVCRLYIPDSSYEEEDFESRRDPEYRSMHSVDKDEEEYIYKRKECHASSIGKDIGKSRGE